MSQKHPEIAVLGGGSWATALIKILSENEKKIGWYVRSEAAKNAIIKEKHNPNYLSSVEIHTDKVLLTTDINEALKSKILLFAIPSAFLAQELKKAEVPLFDKIVVSAIKGIVPESGLIVGDHFSRHYNLPTDNFVIISGPCHAEEVALERLSYLTLACSKQENLSYIQKAMSSRYIKITLSDDVVGAEYAAVLKNIYAIAAGVANGLGYGDNFQSILMSNSIREMKRFIKHIYPIKRNICDSAYLGDLLVTGYSTFSRNRNFGNMIGRGYSVKNAMMETIMVVEGYYACKSAYKINESHMHKLPIIRAMYAILYENKNAGDEIKKLTSKLN